MTGFLELPDVVIRGLLKSLDLPTKLSLRQVCTTTKKWVTTAELLQKFNVVITSDADLKYWQANHEPWCRFQFQQSTSLYDNYSFKNFFATYIETIHSLTFLEFVSSELGSPLGLCDIVLNCKNLQSLTIHKLHATESVGQLVVSNCLNTPSSVNIRLKKLMIEVINFESSADLRSFGQLCDGIGATLEQLSIPKPSGLSDGASWTEIKALQWTFMIQPVLALLKTNKTFKILDIRNMFARHFGELVDKTIGTGVKFQNVNDKQVKYVFMNEYQDEFLGRILSISEKIDDRRPLELWTSLEEMSIRTSRCDIRNYYDENQLFPKLKRLEIVFDSSSKTDPGFVALNKVISLLVNVRRSSVQTLVLKWPEFGHDTPLNVVDIGQVITNFHRVKKITMIGKGYYDGNSIVDASWNNTVIET